MTEDLLLVREMHWLASEIGCLALEQSPYKKDRVDFLNKAIRAVRRMLDTRAALTTEQRNRAQDAFALAMAACLVEPRGMVH